MTAAALLAALLAAGIGPEHAPDPSAATTATRERAGAARADPDAEMLRHLELLEKMELLEHYELFE